jgi:hypothetical protein
MQTASFSSLAARALKEHEGVLAAVLDFVGKGEWIFIAAVSKVWRERYAAQTEGHKRTRWATALANVPRLEMAYEFYGRTALDLHHWRGMRRLGGVAGDIEVILRARSLLGLKCDGRQLCHGAAMEGRLRLLQQLHLEHGCHLGNDIASSAAKAPTPQVLAWLRSINVGEWDDPKMEKLMHWAAIYGRVDNGRWLRDVAGARIWPEWALYSAARFNHLAFIHWAIEEGCGWGEWPSCCKEIQSRPHTAEMLEWLHSQDGFPCSCGDVPR